MSNLVAVRPGFPVNAVFNVAMNANIASILMDISGSKHFGFDFYWSGTPTGTIGISVGTWNPTDTNNVHAMPLIPLTLTDNTPPFVQPAGSPGQEHFDLTCFGAVLQIVYTASSGNGLLIAQVVAK